MNMEENTVVQAGAAAISGGNAATPNSRAGIMPKP